AFHTAACPGLEVYLMLGAANPHEAEVRKEAKLPGIKLRIIKNTADMPRFMKWADICVSAEGSTCWEAAFMQLPILVVSVIAHQKENSRRLQARGVAEDLGEASKVSQAKIAAAVTMLLEDFDRRKGMGRQGRRLVDG